MLYIFFFNFRTKEIWEQNSPTINDQLSANDNFNAVCGEQAPNTTSYTPIPAPYNRVVVDSNCNTVAVATASNTSIISSTF